MNIENLTIIIPIHEFNDEIKGYLLNAIKSIDNQEEINIKPEVLLVYSNNIKDQINDFLNNNIFDYKIQVLINENKTDFQSQINLAAKNIKTKYFSILEFDDEYSKTFIKNVHKYITFFDNVDIFLSMIVEVNNENKALKLTNEASWAQQLIGENGEAGYLNNNILNQYSDFKLSGSIIKTKEFLEIGGFKSNIEMTFMLEFLYRALNNALKIYSMPKILYKHLSTRVDSLTDKYLKTVNIAERKFWFEIAKKEYNFNNDRTITKLIVEENK